MLTAARKKKNIIKPREIILRTDKGFKSVTVSKGLQIFLCALILIFAGWTAYASFSFVRQQRLLSAEIAKYETINKTYQETLAQRGELKNKVAFLSKKVDKMKLAELEIFQRVESLAAYQIGELKANFAGISNTLETSGLSVSSMLAQQAALDNNSYDDLTVGGQGGPFIPLTAVDFDDTKLKESYGSLLTKISKWEEYQDLNQAMPFGKPLRDIRITSRFGARNDPFKGEKGVHKGLDLGAKRGENVYATAGGVVKRAAVNGLYGNMVEIEHSFGFQTRYAHLDKILVKKGERVKTGDVIGLVGSTGRSTAPHLHYEVRISKRNYNPLPFVKAKKNVF